MAPAATIDGDAFRVLFPEEFYERHLAQGARPDGRSLHESRPLTIALGAIGRSDDVKNDDDSGSGLASPPTSSTRTSPPCDGSALVRCGGTAAVAAVTFEVAAASAFYSSPEAGALTVSVDVPPLSCSGARPGGGGGGGSSTLNRNALAAAVLSDLRSSGAIDETGGSLCIEKGVAVFVVRVDVSLLSCDGGERGVALLAAAAALADAKVPEVEVRGGNVVRVEGAGTGGRGGKKNGEKHPPSSASLLLSLPVASSIAVRGSTAIADPDSREYALAHSTVDVVVRSGDGAVLSVEGGSRGSGVVASSSSSNNDASSSPSSFEGLVPLSVLGQAVALGRARATQAAEVLSAALEEAKKGRGG